MQAGPRLFYQIYWDDRLRPRFEAGELAALVKAVAPEMEELHVQGHQLRLRLAGDVEVKIGFDPFVQVSAPRLDDAKRVFDRLRPVLDKAKQEG